MPKFYVGDKVLVHNETAGKLDSLWLGPYDIEVDPSGSNVIIKLAKNKCVKVHVNQLKRYQSKE
jgi:RecB family endonuclease NucS